MAKIIGNTTATPNPQPDWAQTDSTKADYIKNKELVTNAIDDRAYKTTLSTDSTNSYIKDIPENSANHAKITEIGGMTRKCTNLCKPIPATFKAYGYTVTKNDDGSVTISGAATTAGDVILNIADPDNVPLDAGKAYTLKMYKDGVATYVSVRINYADEAGGTSWGWGNQDTSRPRKVAKVYLQKTCEVGDTSLNGTYKVMLNEGSTILPYEPYFEGLRSAPVTEVESVGVNIWDERWKVITWTSKPCLGSANRIPVLPNTRYYMTHAPANGLIFYDANGVQLSRIYDSVFTTPENCYFISFVLASTYGTEYKNDICINKYDTAINRKYYPYVRHILPIPEAVQALDGYGEGVSESVYNYIDYEKKQFVKRVGCVDMGTLDWLISDGILYNTTMFSNIAKTSSNTIANILCADYQTITTNEMNSKTMDKSISYYVYTSGAGGTLKVYDTIYTDVATFKAAMSGVMLYYELATPEVTDISDILSADNYIEVEGGGSLTFKNEYKYDVPNSVDYYIGNNEYLAADKFIGTALRAESDADGNNIIDTYATKEELDELDERTECLKDTEGDNKILRSYQGKWYAVYPSLFAPQQTWYKGTTDKATITEINIVDTYTPTGEEAETWNADADNMGYIKCYVDNKRAITPVRFLLDQSTTIPAYPLVQGATYDSSMARLGLFRYYDSFDVKFDHSGSDLSEGDVTISFTRYNDVIDFQSHNPGSDDYFYTGAGYDIVLTYDKTSETDETGEELGAIFFHIIDEDGALIESGNFYTQMSTSEITVMQINYTKDSVVSTLPEGQTVKEEILDPGPLLTIAGNGYGKLSCHMDSLNLFRQFTAVTAINGADLLDTSSVVNMTQLFAQCYKLQTVDVSNWDVSNVTKMKNLFAHCYELPTVDVSNWDVSNVKDMQFMCYRCNKLSTLDVSNWDVSNVANMNDMFATTTGQNQGDGKLIVDVSKWNPESLETADSMFYGNGVMTSIDLRNWDISKLKSMSHMFADCSSLTEVKLDGLVASSCISFNGMFNDCKSLVSIDLTGFVTSAAEEFQQMFEGCTALTEIKGLNTFVTTNAKAYHEMFYKASSLTELDLSSFRTDKLTTGIAYGRTGEGNRYYPMTDMFKGMNKLQKVTFGDSFEFIEGNYLPAPSADYIEGATGLWKNESTGATYAPADVPTKTAATYVAA